MIPVASDDAFLQHVLSTHHDDIARTAPTFARVPQAGESRKAFLVVRGDENVGVMALRDKGAGVGLVELDWVKPSFRDFTPGEFVYRESHALSDAGFSRVEVEPSPSLDLQYLARMGFVSKDNRWVREAAA